MSSKEIKFHTGMSSKEFDELTEEIKCSTCSFYMTDPKTQEFVCASKYYGDRIRLLTKEQIDNCEEYEISFTAFMNN